MATIKNTKKQDSNYLFLIIGAFVLFFSFMSAFGPFCRSQSSTVTSITSFVLVPSLYFIGYLVGRNKLIATSDLLLFVGAGFAIVSIINFVGTTYNYGFFHCLLHLKTPIYYENGFPFDLTLEATALLNFNFVKVSIEYYSFLPLVASMYLIGGLISNKKENIVRRILSTIIGCIGLACLLFVAAWKALIIFAIIFGIVFIYHKFIKNKKFTKVFKWIFYSLIALAIIYYALLICNAALSIFQNGFLHKLFETNPLIRNGVEIWKYIFLKDNGKLININGLNNIYVYPYNFEKATMLDTNIIEIEIVKEVGLFGVVAFFVILLASIRKIQLIIEDKKISSFNKITLVTFFGCYFIYNSLFYDGTPMIDSGYTPLLRSPIFMAVVLVLGLLFSFEEEKEVK